MQNSSYFKVNLRLYLTILISITIKITLKTYDFTLLEKNLRITNLTPSKKS